MREKIVQRRVRPTHPGVVLRNMLSELAAQGGDEVKLTTPRDLARRLGVSQRIVTDLLQARRSVTADMAIRLSRVFNTTPDIWMNLQKAVDLWDASQANKRDYAKLRPIAA